MKNALLLNLLRRGFWLKYRKNCLLFIGERRLIAGIA